MVGTRAREKIEKVLDQTPFRKRDANELVTTETAAGLASQPRRLDPPGDYTIQLVQDLVDSLYCSTTHRTHTRPELVLG